jgi:hypothetical protein
MKKIALAVSLWIFAFSGFVRAADAPDYLVF